MRASPPASDPPGRVEHSPLPDFCQLPALFALFVVGALTVTVMWLARDDRQDWPAYSVSMFFVTWLALVVAVALCKLRPQLQRLPGHAPYVAVWLLIVVIVALLGAAMLRYFYVLAQWQARLAAVTRAQVEALQARIRPHFLFNSMNTVAALIRVDPAAAERTVEDLSELFRAALGPHDSGDGTLGEELALVDRYLAIEQLRLGPRLRVRRELDDLPAGFPLPRLLLQPLVENAVRHGIQPLREGGEVILRGERDGDGILIEIINPLPVKPPVSGNGHGLDSVRRRVAFRYGPQASVKVTPRGDRFAVLLQLPGVPG